MSKGLSFAFGAAFGVAMSAAALYLFYRDKEQRVVYSSTRDFSEEDMAARRTWTTCPGSTTMRRRARSRWGEPESKRRRIVFA